MKNSAATSSAKPVTPGRIYYSNMISKAAPGVHGKNIYLYEHADQQNKFFLVANAAENEKGRVVIFDASGELMISQLIVLYKGKNTIELSCNKSLNQPPHLIAVYMNEQLAFMQKLTS